MWDDIAFDLERISEIETLSILFYSVNSTILNGDAKQHFYGNNQNLGLYEDETFIARLKKCADEVEGPAIYCEQEYIFFSAVRLDDIGYLFIGPTCADAFRYVLKKEFYQSHQLSSEQEIQISHMRCSRFLMLLVLIYHLVTGKKLSVQDILKKNQLDLAESEMIEKDMVVQQKEAYEEDKTHHTYQTERKWQEAIRAGNGEEAASMISQLTISAGTLSSKILNHTRYLVVCGVTLGCRTAIESGISPTEAYAVSDAYINKVDQCTSEEALYSLMKNCSVRYAQMVAKEKSKKVYSTYVEQCKWYMNEKYQTKITLEDMAEYIGVNEAYLSHLFSEKEGMTIREYLNQVRVERAQNLLKYSNSSLVEISDYVGFSSQSYFGRIFKKRVGMTPQQYRSKNQTKEYVKENL